MQDLNRIWQYERMHRNKIDRADELIGQLVTQGLPELLLLRQLSVFV